MKLNIVLLIASFFRTLTTTLSIGKLPNELKHADVIPVHKKGITVIKQTIGQ